MNEQIKAGSLGEKAFEDWLKLTPYALQAMFGPTILENNNLEKMFLYINPHTKGIRLSLPKRYWVIIFRKIIFEV